MSPAVRHTLDALLALAFFFAAQALVADAEAAIQESPMLANTTAEVRS